MELLGRKGPPSGVLDSGNLTNAPPTSNNTGTPLPVSVIRVPPGAIGNATIPNNSTGTPPPTPLKLSSSTQLAAQQQPQMQQTSGHHHKGQTGASTSSVNSTGH